MRELKFYPFNTNYELTIERICAEDDLPAFWYFVVANREYYGTGTSRARAYLAAEKRLERLYKKAHGPEPSPTYTPDSYATVAGYESVKAWAKQYRKDRKAWIAKVKVHVGWTKI